MLILNYSITATEKSTRTKSVYFYVLNTWIKFQQPGGNNKKKVQTIISPIPTSSGFPEQL